MHRGRRRRLTIPGITSGTTAGSRFGAVTQCRHCLPDMTDGGADISVCPSSDHLTPASRGRILMVPCILSFPLQRVLPMPNSKFWRVMAVAACGAVFYAGHNLHGDTG